MTEPHESRWFTATIGAALNRLTTHWATPGAGRVALCSPVVGVIAGLGAVAFLVLLPLTIEHVLGGLLHYHMPPTGEGKPVAVRYPSPWWLVPAIGALISGLIVFTWAPEAEGHGTDALIRAFHRGGGTSAVACLGSRGLPRSSRSAREGRRGRKARSPKSERGSGRTSPGS